MQVYIATLAAKANDPNATPEEQAQARLGMAYIDEAMSASQEVLDYLMGRESEVVDQNSLHVPYLDDVGVDTISYGHAIKKGEEYLYSGINQIDAIILFINDVEKFENELNKMLNIDITQGQFDALLSLSFNVGSNALKISKTLKLININGDIGKIEFEFKDFNKGLNPATRKIEPLDGLIIRRNEEWDMFQNNIYKDLPIINMYNKYNRENRLLLK